jgi:hypothetical protein
MAKVRSFLYPASFGEGVDGSDKNNCTVRALANATGKPYDEISAELTKAGRKKNTGCTVLEYGPVYEKHGKCIGYFGTTRQAYVEYAGLQKALGHHSSFWIDSKPHKGYTLAKFVKEHPTGSYVVIIKGHNTCVKNGVIIDSHPQRGTATVYMAFKFD